MSKSQPFVGATQWTLRSRSADGTMQDFFEATRFSRKRTFIISNLVPGDYDFFVGIRRDDFFYEQSWDLSRKSSEELTSNNSQKKLNPISPKNAGNVSQNEEDSDNEEEEISTANVSTTSEHRVLRGIRFGVGAALTGLRTVTNNVTLGKIGSLGVEVEVILVDQAGVEKYHLKDVLLCNEKPLLEIRIPIKPTDYFEFKVKSLSTLHSIYVYSSMFLAEDKEPDTNMSTSSLLLTTGNLSIATSTHDSSDPSAPGGESLQMEAPTQMLRRALIIGSRHPERLIFGRALAQACMASCCGFFLGYFLDSEASLTIAQVAIVIWLIRGFLYFLVILYDVY